MRRYLEGEDPDYVVIIDGKIYRNPGGKIRKRRCRSFGFSDSGADVMRIRFNSLSLYGVGSEQEWRIFVNTLDNYWDVWDMHVSDKYKIKKSSSYFKGKAANDWAKIKEQRIISTIWKKYIKYLYNIVADPANRRNNVYIKFKTLTQTDDQSVKDLRYTIKLLKKDILKQSKELKAQSFFTTLRPGLQKEVLRELRGNITTRQEIVTVAQRYKEQFRDQKKSTTTTPTKNTDHSNKNSSKNANHQGSGKNNAEKGQ